MLGANFLWVEKSPKGNILFLKGFPPHIYIYIYIGFAKTIHNLFFKDNVASRITTIDYNFEDIFEKCSMNNLKLFKDSHNPSYIRKMTKKHK
jgi:hypothetical protein